MRGEMIGSRKLAAALVAFEGPFSAVNSMVSAKLVDAVESLFAVRIRTTEGSVLVGLFRIQRCLDLIL